MVLYHTSAAVRLVHRSTVDIRKEATKRLKKVMTEDKMREELSKRPCNVNLPGKSYGHKSAVEWLHSVNYCQLLPL